MTRRGFVKFIGGLFLTGAALGGYAFAVEPGFLLRTQRYSLIPPRWTPGLKLRLAVLADPHLIEPHMPLRRWSRIIDMTNAMEADLILLLGDYISQHAFRTGIVSPAQMASEAKHLQAPLGVYAIIGNHDWWDDADAQKVEHGPVLAQRALEDNGIPVLVNRAVRLVKDAMPFWLTGTDSMFAIRRSREGRDDLAGTLAQVADDAPVIHLAHEPDLFPRIPIRVSLTLSGHTHGGQIRLFGWSPVVPSAYGNRFAYGHIVEANRHLIVSGGLGCSIMPVRFGVPPEITLIDLG